MSISRNPSQKFFHGSDWRGFRLVSRRETNGSPLLGRALAILYGALLTRMNFRKGTVSFWRRVTALAAILSVAFAGLPAFAGIVNYNADADLTLTTPNITLVILSGSAANTITVNPSSFSVAVGAGDKFFVRSNDKYELLNNSGISTQCSGTYSQLDIEAPAGSGITVTVEPNTSTLCSSGGVGTPTPTPAPAAAAAPATSGGGGGGGGGSPPPPPSSPTPRQKAAPLPGLALGTLLKLPCPSGTVDANHSCKAVYYYGSDGKRRPFPNEKAYFTWYTDFANVQEVSPATLAQLPLAKPTTYRPGVRMVKFQTLNKVYAVTRDGTLRWVTSEALATTLYGSDWNQKIDDVSDAFYTNYAFGSDIASASDYSPAAESDGTKTIDRDMGFE